MSKFTKKQLYAIRNQNSLTTGLLSVGMSATANAAGRSEVTTFSEQTIKFEFYDQTQEIADAPVCLCEPLVEVKANGMPIRDLRAGVTEEIAQAYSLKNRDETDFSE